MRAQAMARQRRAARQRARGAQEAVLQLWAHEARRVFGDRLRGPADGAWLHGALDEGLRGAFATSQAELFAGQAACPPFAAFLSAGARAHAPRRACAACPRLQGSAQARRPTLALRRRSSWPAGSWHTARAMARCP